MAQRILPCGSRCGTPAKDSKIDSRTIIHINLGTYQEVIWDCLRDTELPNGYE